MRVAIAEKGWELRQAFEEFNKMGDGLLSQTELAFALEQLHLRGLDSADIAELVQQADKTEDEYAAGSCSW